MKKFFFKLGLLSVLMGILKPFTSIAEVSENNKLSILTIESFKELEPFLKEVEADTLVAVDVDYTLLQPYRAAFQYGNFSANADFVKKIMQSIPAHLKNEFLTAIATISEPQVVDEKASEILKKFQEKGAFILAISHILTGSWQALGQLIEWRLKNLQKACIPLSDFGMTSLHQFYEFKAYRGNFPQVKGGVILTNGDHLTKAQVLEAFFKKVNWRPKKIIFIDDRLEIIRNMAIYAQEHKIAFKGFEYKGAKKAKTLPISKKGFEKAWNDLKISLYGNSSDKAGH